MTGTPGSAAPEEGRAVICTPSLCPAGPAAEQTEAGPFVIEWIPDVLPRCRMGELRIAFEFGHQQGGSDPTKHANAVEILQVVV